MSERGIRTIEATDLEILAGLHRACFPEDFWDRRALAELLAMPGAGGWLALSGSGEPLGFLLVRRAADEAEVLSLGVAPESRRRGLGAALLQAGAALLAAGGTAALFLEVAVDNAAAQALYRRLGFVEVGRRRGYLEGPQGARDALIMRRGLGA